MASSIGMKLGIDGEAEYRKQLNNIISTTKSLDKQMEALQSSFTDETSAMEKNQKEAELLQKKAEKLNDEVEMMQKMVDAAAEKFGESSTECQKWEASLAKAQTELNKTNAELTSHQQEAEAVNSALGQLTAVIDEQTSELDSLKESYVNAALEFGENSTEAQELAQQITDLSAELESNQERLEAVTQAAENLTSGSDETKGALEALTDEITSQQSELDNLRDAYIDAVLEFGESSEEAETLAGQISELSGELQNNQAQLEAARQSLANVGGASQEASGSLNEMEGSEISVGDAAVELAGMFDSNFGSIVQTIANANVSGLMMEIADNVIGVVENLFEMQFAFDEAQADVAVMTGAVGDDLQKMKDIATEAWAAVADKDAKEEDYANIVGMLNTRLGATGDELRDLTELFGIYATTLGVNGAQSVNDLVDVMQKWGLTSEDNATNLNTLRTIMDELTVAQELSDVSVTELAQHLADQSGTFQELGMDIDDAIGFMTAYRDAGGNVSEITRAMDATINHLSGETDNLDLCWDSMINTMKTTDSKMTALSATVGNTGKTISDVFGQKLAGRIYDTFHSAGVDADTFTQKVQQGAEGSYTALAKAYSNSRTDADNFSQWFKETFSSKVLSSWDDIEEGTSLDLDKISEKTGKTEDEIMKMSTETHEAIAKDFGNTKSLLSEDIEIQLNQNLKDTEAAAGKAFSNIEDAWSQTKRTLNQNIELSITAPVISYELTGSGNNKQYTPSVSYRTYADAYDKAMILSAPTIFGAMGNQLLVGGDRAGNEVVVGERHLLDMFTQAVKNAGGNQINIVVNGAEGQSEQAIADYVIDRLQMELIRSEATYA